MAMKFIDGFDHYTYVPAAKKKWDDGSVFQTFNPGRFGVGNMVRPAPSNSGGVNTWPGMTKTTNPAGIGKMIAGAAIRFDATAASQAEFHPFLAFRGEDHRHQVQLFLEPVTGRIRAALADPAWPISYYADVLTGFTPTYYPDSDFVPPFGLWFYLEVSVSITGVVEIYADSELVTSMAGLTTLNSATGYSGVSWMGINHFNTCFDMDDIYIADNDGTHVTDVIGEIRVETATTTTEGDTNDWTPSVGTNNAANVDGVTNYAEHDNPFQYNASTALNAIDLYNHVAFTRDGTVYGVQVNLGTRKDDVGNRRVRPILKTGGTVYTGDEFKLYSDYVYAGAIWPQNPNTAADWTRTEVNAVQSGIKIST